jgi:UDP-glucuronate decarboxylase
LLRGKTILITGATGLLGNYLVKTLLTLNEDNQQESINILCLVRNEELAIKRFCDHYRSTDIQYLVQDVVQTIRWQGPIDYIVHMASLASPKIYCAEPVNTLNTNILGIYNLLELAREKSPQSFLFISSGEVYGRGFEKTRLLDESNYGYVDPLQVRNCYAESKRIGENMCAAWQYQYNVNVKIIRPFHTYGPGLALDDGRVFADFVADVVNRRDITVNSDGKAIRNFCYIADATAAFFTVLLKGSTGEAYNVCDENSQVSISSLASLLASLYPELGLQVRYRDRFSESPYLESPVQVHNPSMEKISRLGWKPIYSLEKGFRRTVSSFL